MTAVFDKLQKGWQALAKSLDSKQNAEKQLLEALHRNYLEEKEIYTTLKRESERIPYTHLRRKLLDIASREEKHADLLAAKIHELDGALPSAQETLRRVRNDKSGKTVLDLLAILEEEKSGYVAYLRSAHLARRAGRREVANLLRQIAEEERQHRRELLDVLTKLNPLPIGSEK